MPPLKLNNVSPDAAKDVDFVEATIRESTSDRSLTQAPGMPLHALGCLAGTHGRVLPSLDAMTYS
jgi:hypothetical protein